MTPDELDRILSVEDSLEPSSGFTANVMESVRQDAADRHRRHFPWLWLAAGLTACAVMLAAGMVLVLQVEPALTTLAKTFHPPREIAAELGFVTTAAIIGFGTISFLRLLNR
jgi:hypothetical protein